MSQSKENTSVPITSFSINATAFVLSCIGFVLAADYLSNLQITVLVAGIYAVGVIALEFTFLKTYANQTTGLDYSISKGWDLPTAMVKLVGLYVTLGCISLIYLIFPEYHGSFYHDYYVLLKAFLPYWLVLAIPYFLVVNRYMVNPKDGYWHVGNWLLGNWLVGRRGDTDIAYVVQHFLGWLVKAFFLPLMLVYLVGKINYFQNLDWQTLDDGFKPFYDFAFNSLFYIDLLIVTVGYCLTFRVFDAHIRSTEYSFLGWAVALMCYQPFWSLISDQYIAYDDGNGWGHWLWNSDIAYVVWGCMILALIAVYVWATLMFGIRFSNLTHRGIITHGAFRLTKHPAYVSKNLSWWLISMPFLTHAHPSEALRMSALLLLLNFIYFMRARTEERHLSHDPDYVAYAEYMEKHGMFRKLGQWVPALRFKSKSLFNTDIELKPVVFKSK